MWLKQIFDLLDIFDDDGCGAIRIIDEFHDIRVFVKLQWNADLDAVIEPEFLFGIFWAGDGSLRRGPIDITQFFDLLEIFLLLGEVITEQGFSDFFVID